MTEPTSLEPSMDEILASIRRIISEDEAAITPRNAATGADTDDDVLVLTERAPPEPAMAHVPAAAPVPATVPAEDRGIVARETALSAAASFQALAFAVDRAAPASLTPVPAASPTLEDLTRDLMRPMLKAWLDENLAAIVQAKVDEEVERIARGRVR